MRVSEKIPAMIAKRDLIFWGATGQAKVLNELIQGFQWKLVALVDNRNVSSPLPSVLVLLGAEGLDQWLQSRENLSSPLCAAVAVGGQRGADRLRLMAALESRGIEIATLIHRTAFVAADAVVGVGCQVLAQSSVCTHATLGRGVIVNTGASVDHDCTLSDGVHIGPGARLAGEVVVDEAAFVGVGAIVMPRIRIGARAIVGAGAVVTRDVPSGCTVVGIPARPLTKK